MNGAAENETHSVAIFYFAIGVTVLVNEITHYLRFQSRRLFKFSNDLNRLNSVPRVKQRKVSRG